MGVAIVVLVLAFGSLVAMSLPLGVALISLLIGTGAIGLLSGQLADPVVSDDGRVDARTGGRDRLRPHRSRPAPGEHRDHGRRARVRRPGQRHGRPLRALRRQHGGPRDRRPPAGRRPDDRRDGLDVRAHGCGDDARGPDAASGTARPRRQAHRQPPGDPLPVPQPHPADLVGPLGEPRGRPPGSLPRSHGGPPGAGSDSRHSTAGRLPGRRQRRQREHPAPVLRHARRGLRPRLQRPAPDRRRCRGCSRPRRIRGHGGPRPRSHTGHQLGHPTGRQP